MASRGVNKVIIVGNLGQDPEIRYSQNSTCFANLSVATSETWKDQQGQQQKKTEWHRIVIVGKLAEIAGEYLRKGSKVYLEGKLETRKWQDQQGNDKYTTEVKVDSFNGVMQMLDSRDSDQSGRGQGQSNSQGYASDGRQYGNQQAPKQQRAAQQQGGNAAAPEPINEFDDDIPF